jgi:hypothetical protein
MATTRGPTIRYNRGKESDVNRVEGELVQKPALIVIAMLLVGLNANAAVDATVDRGDVELNESFTLEIVIDSETNLAPDVAVLDQDFYVGQGNQLSNTTIYNGKIRRSKTFTFILMPKRVGQIVIPAISVGGESSSPLTISVKQPSYAPPGEADVFVTSEIDFGETYVQAQVLYKIKIYRSVATRQPALRDPVITGAESLVEPAGDDRSYEAVIGGTAYNVVERVLALYPQESGEIQISPARFEARVLRDGRITGRKVYESEAQSITVLPTPAPPAEYPDAKWLPARNVELSEDWSSSSEELMAGQPITRHVTISALGQLETQIPALDPPVASGIKVYPDKPDLSRRLESGGIRGVRSDQYAIIGVTPGDIHLPALEVPWWNIEAGEWQVASLPERVIRIIPSDDPVLAPTPPADTAADVDEDAGDAAGKITVQSEFWRYVSEVLAVVWLLTVVAWWWSSRPPSRPQQVSETVPLHKQQSKYLKAARKAALLNDAAAVRSALLEWGKLEWPEDTPRSIGALSARVSSPLAEELGKLSGVSYGPANEAWSGEAIAKAIRSFAVLSEDAGEQSKDILPPLMPADT